MVWIYHENRPKYILLPFEEKTENCNGLMRWNLKKWYKKTICETGGTQGKTETNNNSHLKGQYGLFTHYASLQNTIIKKLYVSCFMCRITRHATKILQIILQCMSTHLLAGMPCPSWCGHLQWRTQGCGLHADTATCMCGEQHGTQRPAGPAQGPFSSW
jgi:hypothetical protein